MSARIPLWSLLLAALASAACRAPRPETLEHLNDPHGGRRYYVVPPKTAAEQAQPAAESESELYAVIGDTILIRDACNPDELTLGQKIDVDGTILLPEIGALAVAGYTRAELRKLLTEKWSRFYSRLDIQVEIAQTRTRKYYIRGEVGSPGEKPILGDLTLLDAVLQASPNARTADLGRVRLIRADPRDAAVFEIDMRAGLREVDPSPGMTVSELDIIYVPPTPLARFASLLERLGDWIRGWIRGWTRERRILIAGGQPA